MVETRNESIGGGYGGWGGADGILGLIALLSLFRGNVFGGNYGGASDNLNEIASQLANVRADIGDVKYDAATNTLNQTIGLLNEISNGRVENVSGLLNQTNVLQGELNGIQAQIAACCCDTNQNILRMGYENQINNLNQTNVLQRQIADCCCSTNLRITELDYQGQLRDQANFTALLNGQTEIKCLIRDTAKDQELARLKQESERSFISNEINKAINTSVGHWAADRAFNGPNYPNPPYNGAWGF